MKYKYWDDKFIHEGGIMKKKDIENLVGESMEDMGLEEHIDERECMDCGCLIEDGNPGMVCWRCEPI